MTTATAFLCAVSLIYDADTLTCADATAKTSDNLRVRIAGVSALERDGSCNAPACPSMKPEAARAAVASLIGRSSGMIRMGGGYDHLVMARPYTVLRCVPANRTKGRMAAWCTLPDGRDLSCATLRAGAAVRWERFDREGRLTRCRPR